VKIILYIIFIFIAHPIFSLEVELLNKTNEEIINGRMKAMTIINKLYQNIYKQLNLKNFDTIKKDTLKLKKTAVKFKIFTQ